MDFIILTTNNNWKYSAHFWQDAIHLKNTTLFKAIEKWAKTMAKYRLLGKLNKKDILKLIQNLTEQKNNVWDFSFDYEKLNTIWVTLVKISTETEPCYDIGKAINYIFTNLPQDFVGQYSKKDIRIILKMKFDFLKKEGIVKSKFGYEHIEDHEFTEEMEEKTIKYIHLNSLKRYKKYYQDDFIEDILDLELEYMENIGIYVDSKLKLFGLEFNEPSKN